MRRREWPDDSSKRNVDNAGRDRRGPIRCRPRFCQALSGTAGPAPVRTNGSWRPSWHFGGRVEARHLRPCRLPRLAVQGLSVQRFIPEASAFPMRPAGVLFLSLSAGPSGPRPLRGYSAAPVVFSRSPTRVAIASQLKGGPFPLMRDQAAEQKAGEACGFRPARPGLVPRDRSFAGRAADT